jgi:hypothetical protein
MGTTFGRELVRFSAFPPGEVQLGRCWRPVGSFSGATCVLCELSRAAPPSAPGRSARSVPKIPAITSVPPQACE